MDVQAGSNRRVNYPQPSRGVSRLETQNNAGDTRRGIGGRQRTAEEPVFSFSL